MNGSSRFLTRMILFLVAVLVPVALFYPILLDAFLANPALNGLILGVLILGIGFNFRQVLLLGPEAQWLEQFRSGDDDDESLGDDRPGAIDAPAPIEPKLLAPMARMLEDAKGRSRFSLSALATRSLLDGIATRLDEARELSRYLVGLSIFLGLLGTFWGLLATVASISDVISGLSISGEDITTVFNDLKAGLEAPLSGMGTAFSSSLFGLAGSLILGFMDLQAGQAQNAFYNDLEEWLSGITKLSSGATGEDGGPGVSAYTEAVMEQTAEGLEDLQKTLVRAEQGRADSTAQLSNLNANVMTLTDLMRAQHQILAKLAESQIELKAVLAELKTNETAAPVELDQRHIRNIESLVTQMSTDIRAGRDELSRDIRKELKILAKTLAATGARTPGEN